MEHSPGRADAGDGECCWLIEGRCAEALPGPVTVCLRRGTDKAQERQRAIPGRLRGRRMKRRAASQKNACFAPSYTTTWCPPARPSRRPRIAATSAGGMPHPRSRTGTGEAHRSLPRLVQERLQRQAGSRAHDAAAVERHGHRRVEPTRGKERRKAADAEPHDADPGRVDVAGARAGARARRPGPARVPGIGEERGLRHRRGPSRNTGSRDRLRRGGDLRRREAANPPRRSDHRRRGCAR